MPKKRPQPERPSNRLTTRAPKSTLPSIPAEAALSFLKDTKGALIWSVPDLADTLKIGRRDAEQVIALLAPAGAVS